MDQIPRADAFIRKAQVIRRLHNQQSGSLYRVKSLQFFNALFY
jgi:hypothetical protein